MMKTETTNQAKINDWRWQIVQSKITDFDGLFFTAVRSTGIYCKPSCRSRLPKRENITFYPTQVEAERAGFRACLRCKPNLENTISPTAAMLVRACEIIEASEAVSLEDLSAELNISPSHLQRIFKSALGVSPKEFADAKRLESFKRQARETDVTTALYESGFGSSRALYEKAGEKLGMTPAAYKKGGKGMKISYAIVESKFGKLLVAATEKGICKISFDETDEHLRQEFPAAEIAANENGLSSHVAAILQHLEGNRKQLDLPLDLQATAFQMRVWAELRRIPYGETRSYKEIAAAIEQPSAVRAVARACATNPVAIVTPCHRVVGSDGKLTGYRWGVERKKELLDKEKKQ
jgi:AraC family transcriptional regulator, regulatory protein of adaptative response / methylated-DNA-[protein]-cysteine methyltransferase